MSRNAVLQLFLNGAWTNVPLYSAAPAQQTRGVAPYATEWPRPATFTCEIDNHDLAWDPTRPESVLYATGGIALPARLVVDSLQRLNGEAQLFDPQATEDHRVGPPSRGRAWVNFTAADPLARIESWTDPVRSSMATTLSATNSILDHFPLEDDREATRLVNTVAGGVPGQIRGTPDLASDDRPFGAAATARLSGAGNRVSGSFRRGTLTTGWQIAWSGRTSAVPAPATSGQVIRWSTTNGYSWVVAAGNTGWEMTVTAADGTVVGSNIVTYSGPTSLPTTWTTFRCKVSVSGGTVTVEPAWYRQTDTTVWGTTWTFSGSAGNLVAWFADGHTTFDRWLCHVYGVDSTTEDLLSTTIRKVFDGYIGDTPYQRMTRTLNRYGITLFNRGTVEGPLMGPTPITSAIEILRECRDTDAGCRVDGTPFGQGVTYTSSRALRGTAPTLTLAYPSQVAPVFRPPAAADTVRNSVTVKNANASQVTATLQTGKYSIQAPPAGINLQQATVDVNLQDENFDLPNRASWDLARLTVPGRRFKQVVVDLLANPGLTAAARDAREGDHIVITGYPPDDVHLMITGLTEVIGPVERTITYETEPWDIWDVGTWSDGIWRWGVGQLAISGTPTSTSTAWTVTSARVLDMLTPGASGFQLEAAGERVTVTVVGAVSGTGPYTQNLTVVRSVNGVIKAQADQTQLTMINSKRWGI